MTHSRAEDMTTNRQLFDRLATALSDLLGQRYKTAKEMARAYKIDPSTAENLRKGHLSVPTLEKVMAVDGMGLWIALGEKIHGQTYAEYLQSIIDGESNEQRYRQAERYRVRSLETRAADLGYLPHRARPQ